MVENRIALVTGAGGGIGKAMTEALANAGHLVAALDRTEDIVKNALNSSSGLSSRILPIGGDIRSREACEKAISKTISHFGTIHMLVNNAGIGQSSIRKNYYAENIMFWEVPDDNWDAVINTNVKGAFLMTKAALPHMINAGWGRIVNVSTSMDTMIRRGWTPYGPSKAALEACSAIWAKDLADSSITVNVLVPGGPVNTGMVPMDSAPNRESLLQPEIISAPIKWLASNEANGFNGRRIVSTHWDLAIPAIEASKKASWPAAWPGVGAQATVSESNPMTGH